VQIVIQHNLKNQVIKNWLDGMDKNCLARPEITLGIHARVMLLANLDFENHLISVVSLLISPMRDFQKFSDEDLIITIDILHRIIESLIQYGADINVKLDHLSKKCWQSFSPVQVAVSRNAGILALLLEHKANPNGQCEEKLFSYTFKDATIFFPIHTAVYQSNIEALSLLLSAGAIVDIMYKRKFKTEFDIENTDQTALHIACDIKKESSEQMIHLLLKAGANPNTIRFKQVNTIKTYETSLHIAIIAQNIKVVLLLVAYGANISIPLIEAGKIIPVEELCETEAVCKAVFTGWTPETHKIYPEKIRKEIFLLFFDFTKTRLAITKRTIIFDL